MLKISPQIGQYGRLRRLGNATIPELLRSAYAGRAVRAGFQTCLRFQSLFPFEIMQSAVLERTAAIR
jgi:hypothetical protein